MKKEEVIITDKSIVLGVFFTDNYQYFTNRLCYTYHKFKEINKQWFQCASILETVKTTCEIANQIVFILDDVYFPINPNKSHTCMELQLICENIKFFNKTIFIKGENVINFDRNLVINQ